MSKLTIEIDTSGEAFQGNIGWFEFEAARLLSAAAVKVARGGRMNASLHDTNGNLVGRLVFSDESDED